MIIVSQDKKHIINFDNIKEIRLCRNNALNVDIFNDYELTLGYYETEERAKEVLQEIMQCEYSTEVFKYKNGIFNASELNKLQEKAFVYEMPED